MFCLSKKNPRRYQNIPNKDQVFSKITQTKKIIITAEGLEFRVRVMKMKREFSLRKKGGHLNNKDAPGHEEEKTGSIFDESHRGEKMA